MILSLPTYSVFILLSSEKENKYVSKDKSNRKFRTEKSVLIVFSMLITNLTYLQATSMGVII